MSKVIAYGADCCGRILPASEIVGIHPGVDMFDPLRSLRTDLAPERCAVHYCLDCYREQVLIPTENFAPRAKDVEKHTELYATNTDIFKRRCFKSAQENRFFT